MLEKYVCRCEQYESKSIVVIRLEIKKEIKSKIMQKTKRLIEKDEFRMFQIKIRIKFYTFILNTIKKQMKEEVIVQIRQKIRNEMMNELKNKLKQVRDS